MRLSGIKYFMKISAENALQGRGRIAAGGKFYMHYICTAGVKKG
jgi:hypothetical protein